MKAGEYHKRVVRSEVAEEEEGAPSGPVVGSRAGHTPFSDSVYLEIIGA